MSDRRKYRDPKPCARHGIASCLGCDVRVPEERRRGQRRAVVRRGRDHGFQNRQGRTMYDKPRRGIRHDAPERRKFDRRSSPEVAEGSTAAVRGEGVGAEGSRVESGPVRIGDDWAGVFIRGDEAFSRALQIDGVAELREAAGDHWMAINLRGFADLLRSCVEPCEATALRRADTPTPDGPNTAEPGAQP